MNNRIWLATGLMLLGVLGVLAFQGYWTYQTYQHAERQLRQDVQAALTATGQQAQAWQRARLLRQYRQWLRDTAHVRISCRLTPQGVTQFTLAGYYHNRPTSASDHTTMSFEEFRERVPRITPAARAYFIRRFTEGTIRQELASNYVFFHTQWLGQQLEAALQRSLTPPAVFRRLLRAELTQRGLGAVPFRLVTTFDSAASPATTAGFPAWLRPRTVGLPNGAPQSVWVALPATPRVVLRQLRGVLLASGLLSGLVLGCFGYAVGTMRRQQQLAELRDDFTHNMTHELQTPVAAIQLAAESMLQFDLPPVTTAEYAGLIGEQAQRLGTLIHQILRSLTLEQAGQTFHYQRLNWPVLVAQTVARHQPLFAQAGRQLQGPDAEITTGTIHGDVIHLSNALTTLLDNALKYGGPHTTVAFSTAAHTLSLHVHDNGPGIAGAYRPQVFDKFFRVPTGNRHAVKGYGLGLHYARQVARQHGGTLTLRPAAAGPGTTFTFTLPLLSC